MEHFQFGRALFLPRGVKEHLIFNDLRGGGGQLGRERRFMALQFGPEPDDGDGVLPALAQGIAVQAFSRFVAQPGQRRALVHDLPFVHQHFLQDAAFQVFDDLGVLGGNDLPLPPADFVDFALVRPYEKQDHGYGRAQREPQRPDARLAVQGRVHFVHKGDLLFFLEPLLLL